MRFIRGKCILTWSYIVHSDGFWVSGLNSTGNSVLNGFRVTMVNGALKICFVLFILVHVHFYIMYSFNHIKGLNGIRAICELSVKRV